MQRIKDKVENPIDYILNLENQYMDTIDSFIKPLKKYKYYIYVEDKGKIGFYELLFENLYPEIKIMIFAKYSGKTELINFYFNEINGSDDNFEDSIILLDRDYEAKMPQVCYATLANKSFDELKLNKHFKILNRTNIENYLFNYIGVKNAIKIVANSCEDKFNEINLKEAYIKIKELMERLSFKYLINQCLMCDFPKTSKHLDFETFEKTFIFEKHFEKLKKDVLENKNNIDELKYKNTYEEIEDFFKLKYSTEEDIDGKMFLTCLIQYCLDKKVGNINKDILTKTLILYLTEECKKNLQEELDLES